MIELTDPQIDQLQPGRETDALVAISIGWKIDDETAYSPTGSRYSRTSKNGDEAWLPHFSTDIDAAWPIVEWLAEIERFPTIHHGPTENDEEPVYFVDLVNPADISVVADTAPMAIIKAALKAARRR